MDRKLAFLAITAGSIIGGLLPALWGAGAFSPWSIITSTATALLALWLAWKFFG